MISKGTLYSEKCRVKADEMIYLTRTFSLSHIINTCQIPVMKIRVAFFKDFLNTRSPNFAFLFWVHKRARWALKSQREFRHIR